MTAPLTVLTFCWKPPPGYRSHFAGEHVDVLRRMVRRHYAAPHRFVCVTDDPRGITEPDVKIFRLWPDLATVRNPSGIKNPSCYRRLRVFARNAGEWLGERFVCLDLDCVIVGDMRPLWDRDDEFVIWRSTTSGNPYNGSMFLHRTGTRPQLWDDFNPTFSPQETKRARFYGSDQAWIGYRLGPNAATWGPEDGVLSFRVDLRNGAALPKNARAVFFHGRLDPWGRDAQRLGWVREGYR